MLFGKWFIYSEAETKFGSEIQKFKIVARPAKFSFPVSQKEIFDCVNWILPFWKYIFGKCRIHSQISPGTNEHIHTEFVLLIVLPHTVKEYGDTYLAMSVSETVEVLLLRCENYGRALWRQVSVWLLYSIFSFFGNRPKKLKILICHLWEDFLLQNR